MASPQYANAFEIFKISSKYENNIPLKNYKN